MNTHTLHDTAVLVVDDDLEMCKLMVHLLRKLECTAEFLNTGPEAIEYLEEYAVPTLIFLDVLMPDLGGLEVLEALKANPSTRDVPVIIYSALIDSKLRSEALRLGACDFMSKARISLGDLRAVVERNVVVEATAAGLLKASRGA
jgi:CheY-like chemotaxis protein